MKNRGRDIVNGSRRAVWGIKTGRSDWNGRVAKNCRPASLEGEGESYMGTSPSDRGSLPISSSVFRWEDRSGLSERGKEINNNNWGVWIKIEAADRI